MASNSSTNSSLPSTLFAPIQVSTTEQLGFILAWVVYCHTGSIDTAALLTELILGGQHATRAAPLKILAAIVEGVLVVSILIYLAYQALSIKGKGRSRWLRKWVALTLWAAGWGDFVILYWLGKSSPLLIAVWLMTHGAIFHDPTPMSTPGSPEYEDAPPVINSPWLAPQRGTSA